MSLSFGPLRFPGDGAILDLAGLEVEVGERLVVFGPNGAGKTTLLRLLAGTLPGGPAPPVAYLPQSPYLFRGSAGWNLGLGLDAEQAARARSLADRFGVGELVLEPARLLSGGERQRVALARVLARPEQWVLLDEPLAPIDSRDRPAIAAQIVEALGGRGAVIVTHDRDDAAALGTSMAVLVEGRLLQRGPVAEVFSLPVSTDVASVVGIGNVWEGDVVVVEDPRVAVDVAGLVVWGVGEARLKARARALFGAEAVTLYAGLGAVSGSARNRWTGRVAELRPAGRLVEVIVDVGSPVAALITPGALEALALETGRDVTVTVKATAVRAVPV